LLQHHGTLAGQLIVQACSAVGACSGNNPTCQYNLKSFSNGVVTWTDQWSRQICQ
jgi:hypothetical protein